jgi:hypothetical protein
MMFAKDDNTRCLKKLMNAGAKVDLQDIVRNYFFVKFSFLRFCLDVEIEWENSFVICMS